MPKASDLKRGSVVEIKGEPYVVKNIEVKSPSSEYRKNKHPFSLSPLVAHA